MTQIELYRPEHPLAVHALSTQPEPETTPTPHRLLEAVFVTGEAQVTPVPEAEVPEILALWSAGEDVLLPVPLHPAMSGLTEKPVWIFGMIPAKYIASLQVRDELPSAALPA